MSNGRRHRNKKTNKRQHRPPQTMLEKWAHTSLHNKIMSLFTPVIGVSAVIYTTTQVRQCAVVQQGLSQTEIAARPTIDIVNPRLAPLTIGQVPTVTVTLVNHGPVPAMDVQTGSRLEIGSVPLFMDVEYGPTDGRPVTIGGNGGSVSMDVPGDHPLTSTELADLQTEMGAQLKVHGETVFCAPDKPLEPLPHVHFCFAYDPESRDMIGCDSFGDYADRGQFRNAMNCRVAE